MGTPVSAGPDQHSNLISTDISNHISIKRSITPKKTDQHRHQHEQRYSNSISFTLDLDQQQQPDQHQRSISTRNPISNSISSITAREASQRER